MMRIPSRLCVRWLALFTLGAPACAGLALAAPPAPGAAAASGAHAWEAGDTPAALESWVNAHLQRADAAVARLLAVKGPRTVDNTVATYDEALSDLIDTQAQSQVLYGVGATKELRDKAQALTQKASAAATALNLNPAVYKALSAVPQPADPGVRHYLERTLLEYRLAGVDRDEATRARIKALQDQITERGLAFERTVHDDVRSIMVEPSQLAGLPPDFLATHKPDASGKVKITTDPPDAFPALKFADNEDLRHRLWLVAHQVGYPANTELLRSLLAARQELAHLLGYATWADFAMADQMIGSPAKLAQFLKQVDDAAREPAARADAALLAFVQQKDPAVKKINAADVRYWQEQYRRAKFNFDSQSVRPYFPYAAVERGVIDTAGRLFHVQIKPATGLKTWHPSVTTYVVYDGATKLGTIYLDMHPREGKDKWFSTSPLNLGVHGRQLPDGALVCNFPGGTPGDPGLMQYGDVVVFLHEFGHLMHHVIGGQNRFAGEGAFNIEGDFIEAPSQMLEEFFHDYGVLTTFAHQYQSGAVLPQELYARMTRADTYARASDQLRQLMYTAASLDYHTMTPATLNFDAVWQHDFERYNTSAYVSGDHFWASFTHLNGYSSNYYTYVLDKVIALDFFAQFDPKNLIGGPTGMRYRTSVLAPGGSRPAATLVHDFLGREMNLEAYKRWMLEEFQPAATTSSSAH
jgi:thimet oligopeptidase